MVGLLVDMSFWSEVPVMTCPFTASALEAGTEIYKEPFMISIFRVKQLPSKRKKAPAPIKRMIDTGASVIFMWSANAVIFIENAKKPRSIFEDTPGQGRRKSRCWLVITTEHSRQNVAEPTKCDIKVKATTYNTYESGRTEPPIEILERLSYLYKVSIDIIVQKQRLFRDAKDLKAQLEETRKELAEIEKQLVEQGADSPAMQEHKRVMETLIKQLEILIQNEETQKELEV